jgi:hypothetical protein
LANIKFYDYGDKNGLTFGFSTMWPYKKNMEEW